MSKRNAIRLRAFKRARWRIQIGRTIWRYSPTAYMLPILPVVLPPDDYQSAIRYRMPIYFAIRYPMPTLYLDGI